MRVPRPDLVRPPKPEMVPEKVELKVPVVRVTEPRSMVPEPAMEPRDWLPERN